ncbi:oligopeptide ABC transporter ATP-binding protein OppF [Mesoplasma corruscae]|uniref:Oligopeptide ABC transporter ATP-binding protein n=1 Tax=Mesoplasma corruscae TaxID=216874 RepID=A0A2S5RHN1_9MOLU|nr:oligopeptide ABC transporter ATP-binding protein OppF [Mesoplasma corruscae]PPE06722.1 oligopeptide ABC transporter ATP-binding protein [Mesoplasma corruscae]
MIKHSKDKEVLLNVRDLLVEFRSKGRKFKAVKGVNFDIYKKEIFGLVGESGSGKTTIGRAIAGVQNIQDGSIYLDNQIVVGTPTSVYTINKEIVKKLNYVNIKYRVTTSYITRTIVYLKKEHNKFKSKPELLSKASWKKIFSTSAFSIVHQLVGDNLEFVTKIVKNFDRINQFITGIHEYIPDISKDLEMSILEKNEDTKNIVNKLKDKMSLDYFDLVEIRTKIKELSVNKTPENFQTLMYFIFEKLNLIIENNDKISRRIKIAKELEEQNLDLSAPLQKRKHLIEKYYRMIYITKKEFIKIYNNPEIDHTNLINSVGNTLLTQMLTKNLDESLDESIDDKYIKDKRIIKYYNSLIPKTVELTDRQISSIQQLIEYLSLPPIDDLVNKSYLFKVPTKQQKRENRKNIQMIFQDPGSSLNERMSVEEVVGEGIENFPELYNSPELKFEYVEWFNTNNPDSSINISSNAKNAQIRKYQVLKLIQSVGLLPEHLSRYPHEFSGGQKQRIGIARSLALKPKIIIADEPISALDVSIRAQVLNLFQQFKEEYGLTYLFITHDLSVVKFIADRIAVIYHGDIVEMADSEELFTNPHHPYTKSLLSAIPQPDPDYKFNEKIINYNPYKEHYDYIFDTPDFIEVSDNHFVLANKRELALIEANIAAKTKSERSKRTT